MPERACPACHEPVLAHMTLCPACRTPVPSEAGPVAEESSAFTFSAPPPRQARERRPDATRTEVAPTPTETAPAAVPTEPVATPDPVPVPPERAPVPSAPEPAPVPFEPVPPAPEPMPPVPAAEPEPEMAAAPFAVPRPAPDASWVAAAPGAGPATTPGPSDAGPVGEGHVSAGTIGTPGATVLDERGNLPGGLTALVSAVLVTVGVFLPWIAVEGREVSGWAASGDAKVLLALAAVATVIAALLIGGARSIVLRATIGVVGVATVALGLYEVTSASGIEEFDVGIGGGLPLVVAGGLVAAVSGILARHRRFLPG